MEAFGGERFIMFARKITISLVSFLIISFLSVALVTGIKSSFAISDCNFGAAGD
ncbi:hypothetical protein BH18THE1_BH18THE1_02600 [soil metagenome]